MTITESKKLYLLVMLALSITVVVVWVSNLRIDTVKNSLTSPEAPDRLATVEITAANSNQRLDPSWLTSDASIQKIKTPIISDVQILARTPSESAEVNDWLLKHGRMAENNTYASYNQAALEKLAAEGDIRAMHTLAGLYLDPEHLMLPEYGFKGARLQLWNAAVYGSTQAFSDLAIDAEVRSFHEEDPAAKRKDVLEIFALYKVAEIRGDRWLVLSQAQSDPKNAPTLEEKQYIENRTQQIYSQLQEQRRVKGLDNFDNSVPDTVKNFFENFEKSP